MNTPKNWVRTIGVVICVAVAGVMILAGMGKAFGTAPPQIVEQLTKFGLKDQMSMIGWGAIVAGILLILPWTSGLGALVVSAYWGGAICIHMAHHEKYDLQALFLVVTWLGVYLRGSVPLFWTSSPAGPKTQEG